MQQVYAQFYASKQQQGTEIEDFECSLNYTLTCLHVDEAAKLKAKVNSCSSNEHSFFVNHIA